MEFTKSAWTTDGDTVRIQMPFAKVDVDRRLVSGFATLDNVDQQGDIVLADASSKAFSRFRGNIREMHSEKIAAGRMVNFTEDEFYDRNTDQTYKGVYVTAYVSKGAQDTWEKVLDGTLSGFSIGGKINDSENQWNKDTSQNVRIVKDYDLIELSLVDSPANQLANVFSIEKSADGSAPVMKGMVAETDVQNVFWCSTDQLAKSVPAESATCSICGNEMESIGWIESGSNSTEKVREVVTKFLGVDIETNADEGGVDNVTEKNETVEQPTEPVDEVEDAPVVEETSAEPVDEVEAADTDFAKMFDDLKAAVEDGLSKTETVTNEAVAKVEEKIGEVTASFEKATSELTNKYDELKKDLADIKTEHGEVTKRLSVLEDETVIKKSADKADDSINKSAESESLFKGTFLSLDSF